MSDVIFYIETDDHRRMSIGADDEKGNGDGYRLAGPKFCGCCPGKTVIRAVLGDRDIEQIRHYLDRYDRMRASQRPTSAFDNSFDPDEAAQRETVHGG